MFMLEMDECIEWHGYRDKDGYGQIYKDGKHFKAHRISYCEHHGISINEINGMVVRHRCDNPPYVNPNHLEIGTMRQNSMDSIERNRFNRHQTKINEEDVRLIRKLWPTVSQAKLSERFGISAMQISRIVHRKKWAHID